MMYSVTMKKFYSVTKWTVITTVCIE